MNSLFEKLIGLLNEEIHLFRTIVPLLEEENDLLKHSDVKVLDTLIKKKESEIIKIRIVESRRTEVVKDIARSAGISDDGLSLTKIAALTNAGYSETLLHISSEMKRFVNYVGQLNRRNKQRVDQSLGLVKSSISMLENLVAPMPVYCNTGKLYNKRQNSGRLLRSSI